MPVAKPRRPKKPWATTLSASPIKRVTTNLYRSHRVNKSGRHPFRLWRKGCLPELFALRRILLLT